MGANAGYMVPQAQASLVSRALLFVARRVCMHVEEAAGAVLRIIGWSATAQISL